MAEALVCVIIEQLASITTQELKLVVGVDEQVQKLATNFQIIQVVLNDAEKRQVKEKPVKLWLDKLKDVAYDVEDVLDEWNTAIFKSEIYKEAKFDNITPAVRRKVWSIIPSTSSYLSQVKELFSRHDIAHKIKELNEKLDEIVREKEIFGFELARGFEEVERKKTTSFVNVSNICGRDKDRVAKAIIQEVEGRSPTITELETLLQNVHTLIKGKKFFLVLDDVWTEDYEIWELFRLVLQTGAQGSRILVTTRKRRVSEIMGSAYEINLEALCDEDCWLIFSKIAFLEKHLEHRKKLEDIGREIAKKCKGLPLAARTLGSLMRFKKSRERWNNVLDSSLWELEDVEKGLFAPLLLSYYELPFTMKRCFSYCAVFPKDYVIILMIWSNYGWHKDISTQKKIWIWK
uniref:NB-ARC domain-containing protein n=1 Tax=Fagus sylvatica TaxID=28930 RepID=A0A2N9G4V1_FAGSY